MSTGYVGRIHGYLKVSWGTLGGWCGSLRRDAGRSKEADQLIQTSDHLVFFVRIRNIYVLDSISGNKFLIF